MSKPIKIIWPVADNASVSALQPTLAAGGNLVINGTLATKDTSVPTYAVFPSIIRAVTLTSTANLSGTVFTITGYVPTSTSLVTAVINGPNATTVSTDPIFFNIVSSISYTANATTGNISVGTGTTGATFWVKHDYQRTVANTTVAVAIPGNTINYTFVQTLDDPFITPVLNQFPPVDGVTVPTIPVTTPMINATVSSVARVEFPVDSSRVIINSSNATGSLVFYLVQQGIT